MKKSIKIAALALAVVPAVCLMTACGKNKENNSGKVDISGNYSQVLVEDYRSTAESLNQAELNLTSLVDSYRVVLNAQAELGDISVKFESDSIMKNVTKAGSELGNEVQGISQQTLTLKEAGQTTKFNVATYLNNSKCYINAAGLLASPVNSGKYYFDVPIVGNANFNEILLPDINFSSILEFVPEGEWGESLVLEKFEKGSTSKYKISLSDEYVVNLVESFLPTDQLEQLPFTFNSLNSVTFYIVFEKGYLQGVAATASASLGIPQYEIGSSGSYQPKLDEDNNVIFDNITVKLNMSIGKYNGSISMPKFGSDYQKIDLDQLLPKTGE